jgi:hypothetical protein
MKQSKIRKQLDKAPICAIRNTGKQWHECPNFKHKKTSAMFQWSPCKYFYVDADCFLCLKGVR